MLSTLARLATLPERPTVVVVDNGSRDGTVEAVRARHREVEVIALDRDRGASARNVALRALDAPYVALCDDDSWWAPGALARAARAMDAAPRVAVLAARDIPAVVTGFGLEDDAYHALDESFRRVALDQGAAAAGERYRALAAL